MQTFSLENWASRYISRLEDSLLFAYLMKMMYFSQELRRVVRIWQNYSSVKMTCTVLA